MLNLKELVFLTDTDTTIGFVSQNYKKLSIIKNRLPNKHYIKALSSLKELKKDTRVPTIHKNRVRRAKRTTFIIKSKSYRVIKDKNHLLLLKRLKWAYTTSANLSGKEYKKSFAKNSCDIEVSSNLDRVKNSSKIYRLNNLNIKRVR